MHLEQIKLFTSPTCPNCQVLKRLMDENKIQFSEVQDYNVMEEEGVMSLPTMKAEDRLLPFMDAVNYIREMGVI